MSLTNRRIIISSVVVIFICITTFLVRADETAGAPAKNSSGIVDKTVTAVVAGKGLPNPFYNWVGNLTTTLKLRIQTQVADVGSSGLDLFYSIVLVFCLGFFHTLGPGHIKTAAAGFVVSTAGDARDGLLTGLIMGVLPGLVALILVLGNHYKLMGDTGLTAVQLVTAMKTAALAMMFVTGLVLTIKSIHRIWIQLMAGKKEEVTPSRHPVITMLGAVMIGTYPCLEIIYMMGLGLAQSRISLGIILSAALITGTGLAMLLAGGVIAAVKAQVLRWIANRVYRLALISECLIELIAAISVAGAGGLMLLLL